MKKSYKNGFTLVELLAVIVILAIILVIAVPKIMDVINSSKKTTLETSVKMIASAAEKRKLENKLLGKEDEEITCDSVAKLSNDYAICNISFIGGKASVDIKGNSKFNGLYVCDGTKNDASATNDNCLLKSVSIDLNEGNMSNCTLNNSYEKGDTIDLTNCTFTKDGYYLKNISVEDSEINNKKILVKNNNINIKILWKEPDSFLNDSWETISSNLQEAYNNNEEYPYSINDYKIIELDLNNDGTNEMYTLRVYNTTPCSKVDTVSKTACGFVVGFEKSTASMWMGIMDMNNGGWSGESYGEYWMYHAKVRYYVNYTLYQILPESLQNAIIDTYVVSSHGQLDTSGTLNNYNFESTDKLYLLSLEEVYSDFNDVEVDTSVGTSRQLDLFSKNNVSTTNVSLIKIKGWTRSARGDDSDSFNYITDSYMYSDDDAGHSNYVYPFFRLAP